MSRPTKRRWLLVLCGVGGPVVCLGVALLYLLGYIYWHRPAIAALTSRDPQRLLATADYLALLGNWQGARPYFAKAERIFAERGDRRNELYAEVSCVQVDVEKGSYAEAARYLNQQFSRPMVQGDARLKLRFLTVKGIVDLNTNTVDAERDWAEALGVAKSLGDITWQTRATGWLGILDFVNGNSSGAGAKVFSAVTQSMWHQDIGAQILFLTYLADGLTEDGMPGRGLAAADRALALVRTNPYTAFPYRTYISKISALTALRRYTEARSLVSSTLNHAREAGILAAQADLLRAAGELEEEASNDDAAIDYFRQAAATASQARLPRIVGEAMFSLANLLRKKGKLPEAERCLAQGVDALRQVEAPYELPHYLAVEAELKAAEGEYKDADELFSQATDLVSGMLVSVPNRPLEGALLGTMSEIYVGHFQLAAGALHDVDKAFDIVARARGRAMADALRDQQRPSVDAVSEQSPAQVEITDLQRQLREKRRQAPSVLGC